jgi:hypothetical protein
MLGDLKIGTAPGVALLACFLPFREAVAEGDEGQPVFFSRALSRTLQLFLPRAEKSALNLTPSGPGSRFPD